MPSHHRIPPSPCYSEVQHNGCSRPRRSPRSRTPNSPRAQLGGRSRAPAPHPSPSPPSPPSPQPPSQPLPPPPPLPPLPSAHGAGPPWGVPHLAVGIPVADGARRSWVGLGANATGPLDKGPSTSFVRVAVAATVSEVGPGEGWGGQPCWPCATVGGAPLGAALGGASG